MQVKIKSNIKQFTKGITDFQQKQVPYVTANAINDTLFDVRKNTVKVVYPRSFPDGKNKTFANAMFKVDKANKRTLTGSVRDTGNHAWLSRQESGGIKRPKHTSIAIPQYGKGGPTRGKWGPSKATSVNSLLANKKKYFSGVPNGMGQDAAGIYKRMGKDGRDNLKLMYAYEKQAQIRPAFPFYMEAKRLTQSNLERNFERQFIRAMKSAK